MKIRLMCNMSKCGVRIRNLNINLNFGVVLMLNVKFYCSTIHLAFEKLFDMSGCSAVGSARGLGPWGRGFKSSHPDQFNQIFIKEGIDNLIYFFFLLCRNTSLGCFLFHYTFIFYMCIFTSINFSIFI